MAGGAGRGGAGEGGAAGAKGAVRPRWASWRQEAFLSALAETGNMDAAIAETGMSRRTLYVRRQQDEDFDAECRAALKCGYERIEAALIAHVLGERNQGPDGQPLDVETAIALLRLNQRAALSGQVGRKARHVKQPISRKELTGVILARLAMLEQRDRLPAKLSVVAPIAALAPPDAA